MIYSTQKKTCYFRYTSLSDSIPFVPFFNCYLTHIVPATSSYFCDKNQHLLSVHIMLIYFTIPKIKLSRPLYTYMVYLTEQHGPFFLYNFIKKHYSLPLFVSIIMIILFANGVYNKWQCLGESHIFKNIKYCDMCIMLCLVDCYGSVIA